ncbi:MAG TPA: dihydroorotate dehydrogenase electron transfer subunit [Planctomycetaceae bacterium]|nr:dihydroorotate dehydrogenase electron transfer subunit [Planctomycetaceae bacterium]
MTSAAPDSCSFHTLPGLVQSARQSIVSVIEQVPLARDTYRLRLEAPEAARDVLPGQFFMIRSPGTTNPLLGRPFALYDTWLDGRGVPAGIDIVYLVVGKMTALMASWKAGQRVEIWGPLGNGFPAIDAPRLLIVAGGIGNTPFPAVIREALGGRRYGSRTPDSRLAPGQITLCYGARSAEYLSGLPDFAALQINVRLATDDGSRGHKGFVTELAAKVLDDMPADGSTAIYCCGPESMMRAVAQIASRHRVPCWLSLETPMACGFGACFSCVTRVKQPDGTWDYRRTCVEGPIFPAEQLVL